MIKNDDLFRRAAEAEVMAYELEQAADSIYPSFNKWKLVAAMLQRFAEDAREREEIVMGSKE